MRDRAATARQWPVRNARWCGPRLPVVSASMALHMPAEVLSCPRQGDAQRRKDYRATGQMCTPPKQTTLCEVPADGRQHCLISFSTIGSLRMFPCLSPVCVFCHRVYVSPHAGAMGVGLSSTSHASWTSLHVNMVCFWRQMPALAVTSESLRAHGASPIITVTRLCASLLSVRLHAPPTHAHRLPKYWP